MQNPTRIGKASAVIGGFLIMIGIILIGIFALAFFNIFDPALLISEKFISYFMIILMIVGILDMVSGFIFIAR